MAIEDYFDTEDYGLIGPTDEPPEVDYRPSMLEAVAKARLFGPTPVYAVMAKRGHVATTDRNGKLVIAKTNKHVRRAEAKGWSSRVGPHASAQTPRAGSPWNKMEDDDLRKAAKHSINLAKLAIKHGRTEHAIQCRLEFLGFDKHALIALDFADGVELEQLTTTLNNRTNGAKDDMKLTVSRLSILLRAFDRSPDMIAADPTSTQRSQASNDLCCLAVADLLDVVRPGQYRITEKGKAFINSLVGQEYEDHVSPKAGKPSATVHQNRKRNNTMVLDDQRFYLVASGDCTTGGGVRNDLVQLKKPPIGVHGHKGTAETEAIRLASASRGEKFFVLQAVSVHEVQPEPTSTRRL